MPSLEHAFVPGCAPGKSAAIRPGALLIGEPRYLAQAFPSAVYEGLSTHFDFRRPAHTEESVAREDLHGIEVIFATWNMPRLEPEFLARAPDLRAVFYAAGTVKYFATPEAFAHGITICGAWRANAIPVAEYTLGVILLSLKKFWEVSRRPGLDREEVDRMGIRELFGGRSAWSPWERSD